MIQYCNTNGIYIIIYTSWAASKLSALHVRTASSPVIHRPQIQVAGAWTCLPAFLELAAASFPSPEVRGLSLVDNNCQKSWPQQCRVNMEFISHNCNTSSNQWSLFNFKREALDFRNYLFTQVASHDFIHPIPHEFSANIFRSFHKRTVQPNGLKKGAHSILSITYSHVLQPTLPTSY